MYLSRIHISSPREREKVSTSRERYISNTMKPTGDRKTKSPARSEVLRERGKDWRCGGERVEEEGWQRTGQDGRVGIAGGLISGWINFRVAEEPIVVPSELGEEERTERGRTGGVQTRKSKPNFHLTDFSLFLSLVFSFTLQLSLSASFFLYRQ